MIFIKKILYNLVFKVQNIICMLSQHLLDVYNALS